MLSEPRSVHTEKWSRYFLERGHDVILLSLTPFEMNLPGLKEYRLWKGTPWLEKADYLLALPKLKKILHQLKPNIFHTHYATKWGWLGALSGYHPFILTAWGSDILIEANKSIYHRFLTRYALRRADAVTANSNYVLERAGALGALPRVSQVIQFGIDLKIFKEKPSEELRNKLNIPQNSPVIFSPRLMKPIYNIETIIEALAGVVKRYPGVVLLLIQYPVNSYSEKIKSMVSALNLDNNIRWVGKIPLEKMPLYYSLATVTLSIPFSDSAAVSVLEAMACGSIPIVSDLPALREIVTEAQNGFLVPSQDPDALAKRIIEVLENPGMMEKIRKTNFRTVREKADQNIWMVKMEELYYRLRERRLRHGA
ncbi:MAG: O-antigen biosynthesis protein WlbH [Calditrichia bacterium]